MEEENIKKTKIKQITIAVAISVAVVVCLTGISVGLYNAFFYDGDSIVETSAEGKAKEDKEDEEEVIIDTREEEKKEEKEEGENKEDSEETKEELSEEERIKQEEERKRIEEEQRKKREEEQKRLSEGYPYWIKVNYTANTVTVYEKDESGNYTVPVKAMICSTGAATPTSGVYHTPQKARWGLLIGPSWGQYCTRITGQILFHSVPYDQQSEDTLHTVYYDRLGITTSLGCIRLTVADAKWLYDNCPIGTSVEFYSSSDPGPLGKPTAMKISGYGEPLNRWDPTDPNPNNPWYAYFSQSMEPESNNNDVNNNESGNEQQQNPPVEQQPEVPPAEPTQTEPQVTPVEPEVKKTTVPNVVGKSKEEAISMLQDFFVVVTEISDNSKSNEVIVEQQYAPGTELENGTTVKIVYNKFIEKNHGTININVGAITGYVEEKGEDDNVIPPQIVDVRVTANGSVIYTNQVQENTGILQVMVEGNGITNIAVTVGKEQRNAQINLNEKNQVISIY